MTGFSAQVRRMAHERANWVCERCGKKRGEHLHHRRPRGRGGSKRAETNLVSNAAWLCLECHHWVEEEDREAARGEGWLVRQNEDPAFVPVLYRGGWVLLDNLGNLLEATTWQ